MYEVVFKTREIHFIDGLLPAVRYPLYKNCSNIPYLTELTYFFRLAKYIVIANSLFHFCCGKQSDESAVGEELCVS